MDKKSLVIGDGGWGMAIALSLHRAGRSVNVWGFDPVYTAEVARLRENPKFLPVVEKVIARTQAIVCGCRSGARSLRAAEVLAQAGYDQVVNMSGGWGGGAGPDGQPVSGWKASDLPVSKDTSDAVSYQGLLRKAGA